MRVLPDECLPRKRNGQRRSVDRGARVRRKRSRHLKQRDRLPPPAPPGPSELSDGDLLRLFVSIDELELGVRQYTAFKRIGLRRLGDLVTVSPRQLARFGNIGKVTVRDTEEMLARLGMRLGMAIPGWTNTVAAIIEGERAAAELLDVTKLRAALGVPPRKVRLADI